VVELSGLERRVGGTSASAPTIASILALVNDGRRTKNQGRVGWVNPMLYKNQGAFTDVTQGGSYGCDGDNSKVGFPAGKGWDSSMGVGESERRVHETQTLFVLYLSSLFSLSREQELHVSLSSVLYSMLEG